MRILIIGAGIGGFMLTALLERRGVRPVIVECAPSFEHAGYMLGPSTLGSCVLCWLGLYQRFVEVGVEVTCYEMHDVRLFEAYSAAAESRRPVLLAPNVCEEYRQGLRRADLSSSWPRAVVVGADRDVVR